MKARIEEREREKEATCSLSLSLSLAGPSPCVTLTRKAEKRNLILTPRRFCVGPCMSCPHPLLLFFISCHISWLLFAPAALLLCYSMRIKLGAKEKKRERERKRLTEALWTCKARHSNSIWRVVSLSRQECLAKSRCLVSGSIVKGPSVRTIRRADARSSPSPSLIPGACK